MQLTVSYFGRLHSKRIHVVILSYGDVAGQVVSFSFLGGWLMHAFTLFDGLTSRLR